MARKVQSFTVEKANRDQGKTFIITEMSAEDAHEWAVKAIFGIMNAGVDMSDDLVQMGMGGIAMMGLKSLTKLPHSVARPLLDQMRECVQIKQELAIGGARKLMPGDFEEAITIFELEKIAITMHIEPFITGSGLTSESASPTPAANN